MLTINVQFCLVRGLDVEDVMIDLDHMTDQQFRSRYKIPYNVELDVTLFEEAEEVDCHEFALQEVGYGDTLDPWSKDGDDEEDSCLDGFYWLDPSQQ